MVERLGDRVVSPATSEEARELLEAAGLPVDTWGIGPTKTFENLWRELELRESELVSPSTVEERNEYGEIIRVTRVLAINVFCQTDGNTWRLREEKQVFKDGRGERRRQLISSLAEKIKGDENQEAAVVRAMQEELGISNPPLKVMYLGHDEVWKQTPTYPELTSKLLLEKYDVWLDPEDFEPDGYFEDQSDKQTFFVWEEVTSQSE